MFRSLGVVSFLTLFVFTVFFSSTAHGLDLINADFSAEAGQWGDGDGPPGWVLSLDRPEQLGVVESFELSEQGGKAFHFNALGRGFGDARIDQCVSLGDDQALGEVIQLSVNVRSEDPDPELAVRLRLDFFSDQDCDIDADDTDRVGADIGLSAERLEADNWTRLVTPTLLPGEIGEGVGSIQLSIRVRDRSDEGQPSDPPRQVWIDAVSLTADLQLLPEGQRQALRDLYQMTDGDNWRRSLNWMGPEGTECQWQGVTCSAAGATIERLDLSGNRLIGELPSSLQALSDLQRGEGLNLCWNELLIPDVLQDMVLDAHLGGDPGFCQGLDPQQLTRTLSGLYFQPTGRDGEGFSLNMLGAGAALLFWATYDDDGQPLWLFGTGRARDRILSFDDLYVTRGGVGNALELSRDGQASLIKVTPDSDPDAACHELILRFSVDVDSSLTGSGRSLINLDPWQHCPEAPETDMTGDWAGAWFDPQRNGEGISLVPVGADRKVLTWFGYNAQGAQQWRIGISDPAVSTDSRLVFPTFDIVSGGNFDGVISPPQLTFEDQGQVVIEKVGEQRTLSLHQPDASHTVLNLVRIEAAPDLLASSGLRMDLTMAPDQLRELYRRSPRSDDRLPGSVQFDGGEAQALTGLRFRGNTSRFLGKKSFNIRFESPQAVVFDSDRMNLNAMYTDPSFMHEALSFELFRDLGLPAPKTRHIDLWINGIYEGTYIHIQRVDETLLAQNGLDPDGTLVRDQFRSEVDGTRSAFRFDYGDRTIAEIADFLSERFDSRGDPDWTALAELVDWAVNTPAGDDFAEGFKARFDLEAFIDWWALHWLIGDIDSLADDHWLYRDTQNAEAKWLLIPWDKDLSFGSHFRSGFGVDNDFFHYGWKLSDTWLGAGAQNDLFRKFFATPSLREQIYDRTLVLIDEFFDRPEAHARIDHYAELLEDSVSIRPGDTAFDLQRKQHHAELGRWHDHVEATHDFVTLHARAVRAQIVNEDRTDELVAYEAEETIEATGQTRLHLTDESGWTIATLEQGSSFALGQQFAISVTEDSQADQAGIDRVWTLDLAQPVEGLRLTLYYRNEVWSRASPENWWFEDLPISNQDELRMVVEDQALPTRINPYANKAVATVDLPAGEHRVRLRLGHP